MSTPKAPAYLISGSGAITLHAGGKVYAVGKDHVNYKKIIDAVKAKRWKGIGDLFDTSKAIVRKGKKQLSVKNGEILYGGERLANAVVDRIHQFMQDGLDFKPLFNFLKRLVQNPSKNSVEQLYRFMEANKLPVTWDGYLLAYKKVRSDMKDFHTGTIDNSPGVTVKMERKDVVEDPNTPCHRGLHVGGYEFARTFNGEEGKLVTVKVDPANIVSVPFDYSSGKCRTCEYTVLEVLEEVKALSQPEACAVGRDTDEDDIYDDEDECPECGEIESECTCDDDVEYCDKCGEPVDECECESDY